MKKVSHSNKWYHVAVIALFGFFTLTVGMVGCGNRDEGNKDNEILQAKSAYDRCLQLKGQAYCNSGKIGTVSSISEYYGQGLYTNYGYYNYNGLSNYSMVSQLTTDQVNVYFENYLKKASKQEILTMTNRWLQMSTEVGMVNTLNYPTRCTSYGCF